ncbi:MAG: modulated sigma54 specific transcriptional regulator, Fis family [Acidimicrobiales bacterium]|nr:modulated sigma54 specific transcriptional regulator, Fis family [Acidimicrobiales bacterium]
MTPVGAVLDPSPSSEVLRREPDSRRPPDADGDELLVRAGRPVLDQLATDLDGAPVGVVLTNAVGDVLDLRAAEGADILTAPAGAEARISHPRSGRPLGAIRLTSLAWDESPLMLPLALRAAREIEDRLVNAAEFSERLLFQRFLQERRRAKGPIVLINQRTMIANAAANRFVSTGDEEMLWDCAMQLLAREPSASAQLVLRGTAVEVGCEPVLDGNVPVAALLRLAPVADARADASRTRSARRPYGWDSITETEATVIECVARGLTNRKVGEQLFMSRHTVDFHLRSVFRKLDVSSRVDLTRLALQRRASAT